MKRVKFFIFLLPAIILLFALPRLSYSAYSDSQTFEVTKDTHANSAAPYVDNNYGSAGSVVVSNKPIDRFGYLQFENIDLPEGAILDSATLKFYVHEQNYEMTAKLNIGPVTGDWEENTLTWNNKPTINQTQAIEAEISLDFGWKEISITHLVRQWRDGSIENKGLFIYPYGFLYGAAETDFAFSFKTKEAANNPPKLEVTYHFEPSPTPSPSPSPSPEVEEEEVIGLEEPSPTPEESPSPSPEAEEGKILGIFSTGQALIAGLILLALIGAGIAFVAYARKPKKKVKKKKKVEPKEEEPKEEKPEPEEKEEPKEEEEKFS